MGERYIQLNGDAINEPLYRAFHRSSGIQTTGLLFAFNAATMLLSNDMTRQQGIAFLTASAITYGFSEAYAKWVGSFPLKMAFNDSLKTKCIDTAPDRSTPPTNPSDMFRLKKCLRMHAGGTGAFTFGMFLFPLLEGNLPTADFIKATYLTMTDPDFGTIVAFPITVLARNSIDLYRLYKVAKGDYAIINTPKPEPKKETVSTPNVAYNPT